MPLKKIEEVDSFEQILRDAEDITKNIVTKEEFDVLKYAVIEESAATSFYVSSVNKTRVTKNILESLKDARRSGVGFNAWKASINSEALTIPKNHLETIYRNWLASSTTRAQFEAGKRSQSIVPYYKYGSFLDGKTRINHRLLDGIVLPKDHPFWRKNMPPNGHKCRCEIESLTSRNKSQVTSPSELSSKVKSGAKPDSGWDYDKTNPNKEFYKLAIDSSNGLPGKIKAASRRSVELVLSKAKTFTQRIKG